MAETILSINDLKTYFYTDGGVVPAVDGLDFSLKQGEVLAIVGESGCGKSVTSLSILRLIKSPPGKIVGGSILYAGEDLVAATEKRMQQIRGNDISMIFQEPMTSLNPVYTIGHQLIAPILLHQKVTKERAREIAVEMIKLVGIPDPEQMLNRYPHQISGGMRQRIMIAMALACKPKIIIADEPTTALDVTIQAQIMNLLKELQEKTGTSIILITHDLGIVAHIADHILVMYAGKAVEYSDLRGLYAHPLHPYTEGLLKSIPNLSTVDKRLFNIPGNIPSPKNLPKGCAFSPRCPFCKEICKQEMPEMVETDGRKVRCWKYSERWTNG